MVAATAVTVVLALMMRGEDSFEKRPGGYLTMGVAAAAALMLWLGGLWLSGSAAVWHGGWRVSSVRLVANSAAGLRKTEDWPRSAAITKPSDGVG